MLNISDENEETLEDIKETEAQVIDKLLLGVIKGILQKKKTEIYWSLPILGGGVHPNQYISLFFLKAKHL